MGYLRETEVIKGIIPLTITDDANAIENCKSTKDDVILTPKNSILSSDDYLKKTFASLDAFTYVARRRMFEVNGDPLDHWKKDNFEAKRDDTCRIVYEPKIGKQFFRKTLRVEDYALTRCLTTSLEQPYFSKYNRFFPKKGHFCCKACGNPLYTSETKIDVDDGWPAFGACVLGSIGVTSVEERMAQIERKEQACVKIQAFVRGHQSRHRVENMLDELIEELLRRKNGYGEYDDRNSEGHLSCDFSWSSSSDDSDSDRSRRSEGSDGGFVLSRDLGDDCAEVHCHRCKSHLGDLIAEENTGNNGESYRERHRINGRALKYMGNDLPKRTVTDASPLFADTSHRRRFGLLHGKEKEEPSLPFGKMHWMRKTSDPLSVSNHENFFRSGIRRKRSDPLSVSCHARTFQRINHWKPSPAKEAVNHSKTISTNQNTGGRRRPMRRGNTDTSIRVDEQTAFLQGKLTLYRYYDL